jgi:hypothetical protein
LVEKSEKAVVTSSCQNDGCDRTTEVKTIHTHSWAEFLDQVSQLDQWAFRGYSRADLPLLSSLSQRLMRFSGNQQLWPLLERRTLRIFRRKAHVHVTDPNLLQNDFRCLASYSAQGESLLVQLVLDKSVRQEAMKELYRMNITYASLWPDMDGLSRSMNQELEIVWQPLIDEFL